MGDVVEIGCVTSLDVPPEKVLQKAIEAKIEDVIVLGWDADGEFYVASSAASGPEFLWKLELARQHLMQREPRDNWPRRPA